VRSGIAASLAQPGGNITGVTNLAPEMVPKRLELLKEAVPYASRVAFLWNPANQDQVAHFQEAEAGARVLALMGRVRGTLPLARRSTPRRTSHCT
jgi:putative tryptophan/tyrosine transport system substrate-binding protein